MVKKYDLAVKVGTYTGRDGQEKNQYENIGEVHEKEDGGKFILLKSLVLAPSLLMLANKNRNPKIIISMFEPRNQEGQTRQAARSSAPADQALDDDIPF